MKKLLCLMLSVSILTLIGLQNITVSAETESFEETVTDNYGVVSSGYSPNLRI